MLFKGILEVSLMVLFIRDAVLALLSKLQAFLEVVWIQRVKTLLKSPSQGCFAVPLISPVTYCHRSSKPSTAVQQTLDFNSPHPDLSASAKVLTFREVVLYV